MHSTATLGYFSAPQGHYWQWEQEVDSQAVIWLSSGGTIALREELNGLLGALVADGLPPLGAILLVTAAASGHQRLTPGTDSIAQAVTIATGDDEESGAIKRQWGRICYSLDEICNLPEELRAAGPPRERLMRLLFEGAFNRLPASMSAEILEEFRQTPSLDVFKERTPELNGLARILRDLSVLTKAFDRIPPGKLEQRLRSGLDSDVMDEPELPVEPPEAGPPPADLMLALEKEGGELAQIAGLVKQLSAILHVSKPMALQEDLPVGGVSDITNRGAPDRLLLTELAWDELTFAARLAHHEALYTRRESPPAEPPPHRLILLDTGIHLWGKPRLFALGAALALLRQVKRKAGAKGEREENLAEVRVVLNQEFQATPLATVEQVRLQLERLDAMPHPGAALASLVRDPALSAPGEARLLEVFCVTHPAALRKLMPLPAWREFAGRVALHSVEVDREGHLRLARHGLAGMRVLSEAQVDLDTLLAGRKDMPPPSVALTNPRSQLPRFYNRRPWPLYHLSSPSQGTTFELPNHSGSVGISPAGCVCYWRDAGHAARVLMPDAPSLHVKAFADQMSPDLVCLAFRGDTWDQTEAVVLFLSGTHGPRRVPLSMGLASIQHLHVHFGALVVHTMGVSEAHSLNDGKRLSSFTRRPEKGGSKHFPWFDGEKFHEVRPPGAGKELALMQVANPKGKETRERLAGIIAVGFGHEGGLFLQVENGAYLLRMEPEGDLFWFPSKVAERMAGVEFRDLSVLDLPDWPLHGLAQAVFVDGRRVLLDRRGFLHVIDTGGSDALSILLVKGSTVAWRSNGFYYGDEDLLWDERLGANSTLKKIFTQFFRAPTKLTPQLVASEETVTR